MSTRLFLGTTTANTAGVTTTERSAAMTAAVATPQVLDLIETNPGGASPASSILTTPVGAGPLWGYHAKFVSAELVGLIGSPFPAGTYTAAVAPQEDAAGADALFACAVYVRHSDGSRDSLYDSATGLGIEYGTSTPSAKGRVVTFTGVASPGNIAAGDQLVFEAWSAIGQGDALSHKVRFYWGGSVLPVQGTGNANPASYLDVPADGLFNAVTPLPVAGTTDLSGVLTAAKVSGITAAGTTDLAGVLTAAKSSSSNLIAPSGQVFLDGELVIEKLGQPSACGVSGILPWLVVGGIEVCNMARTYEYVRNLLPGIAEWGCPPPAILYRTAGEVETYSTPVADGAPWFQQGNPASAEFLGFIGNFTVDTPVTRSVVDRQRGGAAIGPRRIGARSITGDGLLLATTDRGREYGIEWLTDTLLGCGDCDTSDAQLYHLTPRDSDPESVGRFHYYDVALATPPTIIAQPCPEIANVTFTLTAGTGERFGDPETVLGLQTIPITTSGGTCIPFDQWWCAETDDRVHTVINPPPIGELALVLTVDSTFGPSSGLLMEIRQECSDPVPLATLTLGTLEAGSYLVVDAARQIITYITPEGDATDGIGRIDLDADEAIPWLALARCSDARCVSIGRSQLCAGGEGALVGLQTVLRIV